MTKILTEITASMADAYNAEHPSSPRVRATGPSRVRGFGVYGVIHGLDETLADALSRVAEGHPGWYTRAVATALLVTDGINTDAASLMYDFTSSLRLARIPTAVQERILENVVDICDEAGRTRLESAAMAVHVLGGFNSTGNTLVYKPKLGTVSALEYIDRGLLYYVGRATTPVEMLKNAGISDEFLRRADGAARLRQEARTAMALKGLEAYVSAAAPILAFFGYDALAIETVRNLSQARIPIHVRRDYYASDDTITNWHQSYSATAASLDDDFMDQLVSELVTKHVRKIKARA